MNRKSVIATIKSICHDNFIESSLKDGSGIRYLPIFKRPYDSLPIGISENGFWCLDSKKNQITEFITGENEYRFFLLLYTPLKELIELIKNGLSDLKLPEKTIITFPFDELIIEAIKRESCWKDMALKWIDEGYPLNDEMRLILCNSDKQSKMWLKWKENRLGCILGISK